MVIDNSLIAPNPFSPDRDTVEDITWISFDVKLWASQEQLRVLGFGFENLITISTEDDDIIHPFALIGISVFDSTGEETLVFRSDLDREVDTDLAPNGWPNGIAPPDVPVGSGNILGFQSEFPLPDFADEKEQNDWDTLLPLDGPFESEEGPYYRSFFSLGWDGGDTPDGTYIVSIIGELVGRTWKRAGYMKSETGLIIGEKWHAEPSRHHGVVTPPVRKSVIVDRRDIRFVDDDPPLVTSTIPSAGSVIDPAREQVKEIIVGLEDGAGGSGVDPVQSTVDLLDPLGNKMGGQIVPLGINTIKLVLDSELAVSGEYTIMVIPVDKRGNKSEEAILYTFEIQDTSAPFVVDNTIRPVPTEFDDEGNPIDTYNQPIEEVSVILSDGLTGSGVDLDNSNLYVRNSADEVVVGDLKVDMDNKKLIYTPEEPITVSDTYTIVVNALDKAGAKGIYTYKFVMDMAENIIVRYEGRTYLMIYSTTTVLSAGSGVIVDDPVGLLREITVQKSDAFPQMIAELAPLSGFAMEFQPHELELSQESDLNLYYEDDQLPLGIEESELGLYAYKAQSREWIQLTGAVISEEENKIKAKVNYIDQYYIIAYTSPVVPSVIEEVTLEPPKYFNPDRESLTFSFARTMTDYKVEIYNVSGDRVVVLEEQGRNDRALGWDGRNEDNDYVRNGVFICRITFNIDGRPKTLNRLVAVVR
jgi:hypothetical protein